jgi:hypothetical protein
MEGFRTPSNTPKNAGFLEVFFYTLYWRAKCTLEQPKTNIQMSKRGARRKQDAIELKKRQKGELSRRLELEQDIEEARRLPTDKLYLYLTEVEWARAWIEGGTVPLAMTSKYRSLERSGILTPDEDVHRQLNNAPYEALKGLIDDKLLFHSNFQLEGVTIRNRALQTEYKDVSLKNEVRPALVLCLSTKKDAALATRLGKKACVEVTNPAALKIALDQQVGRSSTQNKCDYTFSFDRNHFLKSAEDAWQCEYRFIWSGIAKGRSVEIPPGTGRLISFTE